jgi:hypothetical protein
LPAASTISAGSAVSSRRGPVVVAGGCSAAPVEVACGASVEVSVVEVADVVVSSSPEQAADERERRQQSDQ